MMKGNIAPWWCHYSINPGVDREMPGLYQWKIEGVGCYIGKYKRVSRPEREYERNVERLRAGQPYRKGRKQDEGFRKIHFALAEAVDEGRWIELRLLESAGGPALLARERTLIRLRGNLNGTERGAAKKLPSASLPLLPPDATIH